MGNCKKLPLGSGFIYGLEFTGMIPTDEEIEVKENILGYIQNGCVVSYTPSFYEAKDDLGMVSKKMITDEVATVKTGLCTWNGETLEKLCQTARITEDETTRIVKIGGVGNYDDKKYIIHFVHKSPDYGFIKCTVVATNEAGFELAFQKDKESTINTEWKAYPTDEEGTLIIYKESKEKTV